MSTKYMMKVIQAAGRIFRTPTDKGVIILLGKRFTTPYYRAVLPPDWDLEIPTGPTGFAKFQQSLTEFWDESALN